MNWCWRSGPVLIPLALLTLVVSCSSTEKGQIVVKTLVEYTGEAEPQADPKQADLTLVVEFYRKRWKENTADPDFYELLSEVGPMPAGKREFEVSFYPDGGRTAIQRKRLTTDQRGRLVVPLPVEVLRLGQEKKGARLEVKSLSEEEQVTVKFEKGSPRIDAESLAIKYFYNTSK